MSSFLADGQIEAHSDVAMVKWLTRLGVEVCEDLTCSIRG